MKKTLTLLLLLCCMQIARTQNTIVNDNSSWATLITIVTYPPIVHTEYVYFDGDSIFNEKTYKKVYFYKDELHLERFFAGLIREENKKTYFAPYKISLGTLLEESFLYDFSLEEGDMFEYVIGSGGNTDTIILYVLQSDYVLIDNEQKKRLMITPEHNTDWVIDTIIENVGSLHGLLYPISYMTPGAFHELLCYTKNSELLYQNPRHAKCYYDNPNELSVQTITISDYNIFPNPVTDILNISSLSNLIYRIEILDKLGRKFYSQAYKETIDVSAFPKGLYIVKVYDVNNAVSTFKMVKR